MRKAILLLILIPFSGLIYAQTDTLITLGNDVISSDEFLAVYNKNKNVGREIDPKTPAEYLDLYINFKLKVKEAIDLGRDTMPGFQREFRGYRAQLAKPYLVDKKAEEMVLQEAYDRMNFEVKASHIMIDLPADALPADTLKVYNQLLKVRKEILDGASFEDKAKEISTDTYSAVKGGDLGYFTVFNMVYPFETAAYNTKVGEISMPIRSPFGYHLIKVYNKRDSRGRLVVAHIFLTANQQTNEAKKAEAERKINEIYSQLTAGAEFDLLAKQYSSDKNTSSKGGVLPQFGLNEMMYDFQEEAYALQNPGDYSKPFKTDIGWHIVKLVEKVPVGSYEDVESALKEKIKKDARSSMGANSLIVKLKKEYSFKEYPKRLKDFNKILDETLLEGKWDAGKAKSFVKTLFVLDGKKFSQYEFSRYVANTQRGGHKGKTPEQVLYNYYNNWINASIMLYENSKLEEKYPDFKLLVNEYRDGILLFDLTQELVWDKASKDSVGLAEFYEANKTNYMWGERVDAVIFSCVNKSMANKIIKSLNKSENVASIIAKYNESSELNVTADSSKFSRADNALVDAAEWKVGASEISMEDERAKFVYIIEVLEPAPKKMDEARGLIISDYQKDLEAKWIAELRAKYPVKVNEVLFKKITTNVD